MHRDLKPSNILLSSAGGDGINSLKIADFSMAMSVKDGPITTNGGDPVNVAPEMLLAKPYLTVRTIIERGVRVPVFRRRGSTEGEGAHVFRESFVLRWRFWTMMPLKRWEVDDPSLFACPRRGCKRKEGSDD